MDEAVIKKIPPHSMEAERAVVGSMILDNDVISIVAEMITEDDFYGGQYGQIFQALVELYQNNVTPDLVTLQEKLQKMNTAPEVSSPEFLAELTVSVPTSANVKHYAKIVQQKAILRRMIHTMEDLTSECYQEAKELEDIMQDTEDNIFEVLKKRDSADFEPIQDVVLRTLSEISELSRMDGKVTGISTGFRDLNDKTAGLHNSDLVLLAARPAMGKTAFVLNIAEHVVLNENKSVAIFSLEMGKEQLLKRMLSIDSRIDAQKFRTGELEDEDWGKLVESVDKFSKTKLVIDDTSGITAAELRTKCRKLKLSKDGLDLVIIDYLQLMTGAGKRKGESRQQEISDISRSLKVMARELNVPVIALSQLSRAVEQRPDKRPMLSDLRESGAIEQDADMVMFLYRDDYYNEESEEKNVTEVIIAKQRSGPTGKIKLAWLPALTKFGNLAQNKK